MNGLSLRRSFLAGIAMILLAPQHAFAINCRVTVYAFNFGTYMPMTPSHTDVVGQVTVRCQAQPGSFSVTIGPGISGDQTARTLTSAGPDILYYNLFRDPARTQIWGDGTPPTFVVSGVRPSQGRPTFYDYPIYGRIFANQAPNPGIYNDTPMVTVLF
jgi:spore coat protein U-like protein